MGNRYIGSRTFWLYHLRHAKLKVVDAYCDLLRFRAARREKRHLFPFQSFFDYMRWPFSNLTAPGYSSLSTTSTRRINTRLLFTILKWIVLVILAGITAFFIVCRVDTHMRIYVRFWLSPRKPVIVEPLSEDGACFSTLAPQYQQGYSSHSINMMPGYRMQDDTCYGYARTLKKPRHRMGSNDTVIYFHTTWSSADYESFGETQLATLRSFVATQDPETTRLIVWIDEKDQRLLDESPYWKEAAEHTDRIWYEIHNTTTTTQLLSIKALSTYGGVWFNMNTFFVRDLEPLLVGNEWMSQATCYTSVEGNPFSGSSMMYFTKDSPYLCELENAINDSLQPIHRYPSADIGRLYYRIYERILRNGYKPWAILPWCYFEPSQCTKSLRFPSPFASSTSTLSDHWLDSIFAYHYHDTPPSTPFGAIYESLNNKYKDAVDW